MYIDLCISIYLCVYIYITIYTQTHIYTYISISIYLYLYLYLYLYVFMHIYIHIYIQAPSARRGSPRVASAVMRSLFGHGVNTMHSTHKSSQAMTAAPSARRGAPRVASAVMRRIFGNGVRLRGRLRAVRRWSVAGHAHICRPRRHTGRGAVAHYHWLDSPARALIRGFSLYTLLPIYIYIYIYMYIYIYIYIYLCIYLYLYI